MRMDLKKKILSVAILPILLVGTVTIVITLTQTKNALINLLQSVTENLQ